MAEGRITTRNLQAHHIIPLEESTATAYDMEWIITLCSGGMDSCHERAERGDVSRELLHRLAGEPVEASLPPRAVASGRPAGV